MGNINGYKSYWAYYDSQNGKVTSWLDSVNSIETGISEYTVQEGTIIKPNVGEVPVYKTYTRHYRSKVEFNTGDKTINSPISLTAKIQLVSRGRFDYTVARLSDVSVEAKSYFDDNDSTKVSSTVSSNSIASSFYTNSACTTKVASDTIYSAGTTLYIKFNLTNQNIISMTEDSNYYIYFGREGTSYYRFCSFKVTDINLEYTSYTKCTAPTTVSATGIITPSGSFTVSWSGAKDGANNPISGYKIYWRITSNAAAPTTSTYSENTEVESSKNSYTINLSNATRGYKVVCGVVAIGTVSGYDSEIKTGGLVTINSLPAAPKVSISGTILPSNGKPITGTIEADGDSNTEQELTTWYRTKDEDDWQKTSSFSITDPGTYEFQVWDGLEGTSIYKTITKNSKPEISLDINAPTVSHHLKDDTTVNYCFSPTVNVYIEGGQSSNNYTYYVYYSKERWETYPGVQWITLASSSETTYSITDIRKTLEHKIAPPFYYAFCVRRNDGIEYVDAYQDVGNLLYIPEKPELKSISNRPGSYTGVTTDPLKDKYSQGIQPHFYKDDGYDQLVLTDSFGTSIEKIYSLANSSWEYLFYSSIISLPNQYGRGGTHSFYCYLQNSKSGYKTNLYSLGQFTRIRAISEYTNEQINARWPGIANPFNAEETQLNCLNFWQNNEDNYNLCGFSNQPEFYLKANYTNSEAIALELTNETSENEVILKISGENTYNLFSNLNLEKNSAANQSVSLVLFTENDFGDIYQGTLIKEINWATPPVITNFILKIQNKDFNSAKFLKEAQAVSIDIEVESYHGAPTSLQLNGLNGQSNFYNFYSDPQWEEGTQSIGYKSPKIYSLEMNLSEIGHQSSNLTSDSQFTVIVNNIIGKSAQSTKSQLIPVLKHSSGSLTISNASYNPKDTGGGLINFTATIDSLGIEDINNLWSKCVKYCIQLVYKKPDSTTGFIYLNFNEVEMENDQYNIYVEGNAFSKTFSFDLDLNNIPYIISYLEMTVEAYSDEFMNSANTSYTVKSNEVSIYNLVPTVAYRQNHIGINIADPSSTQFPDGAVIIGTHTGKNKIYLRGERTVCAIVDILTGALSNFIVDAGSWDDTPGGIIPGGGSGDIPTGLAQIAYTGEVADLEQERTDVIIISGGSSIEQI